MGRAWACGKLFLLAGLTALSAQTEAGPPERLTLETAILEALGNNLGLRAERLDPINADDAVEIAEAGFDPLFTASLSHAEGEQIAPVITGEGDTLETTTISDNRSYAAGIQKRLAMSNATLSATTRLSRNDGTSFNSEQAGVVGGALRETASFSVGVTQPLLRDFGGEIATADLERARSNQRAARLQLKEATLSLLSAVEQNYWRLAEAIARRDVRETNRQLAERLLEETTEREKLGLATQLDVIQAEANLAQREEDILVSDQGVSDAKDALLGLLGRMHDGLALAVELDVEGLPPIARNTPELDIVWREALTNDFNRRQQEEVIAQREIDRLVARNDRKPTLDLNVAATLSGLSAEDAFDAYGRAIDREGEDWNVRFSFSYPLGQRAANANLRTAERRLDQAEIRLIELKQDLLQEVRSTWRELDTRKRRLRAAELLLRLQEQTFEQERSRLDEGLSTLRDVLEIQRDLDDARLSLLSAQAAAIQAEVRLERLRGTLLQRHRLTWPEVAPVILK